MRQVRQLCRTPVADIVGVGAYTEVRALSAADPAQLSLTLSSDTCRATA